MSSPVCVNDTSEPEDRQLMTTSWILPAVPTSTGVDTGAMPTTDLEQVAWDASVMPVSTGTGTPELWYPQLVTSLMVQTRREEAQMELQVLGQ